MARNAEKYISSFFAYDSDGLTYTIHEFQSVINCGTCDDPNATISGQSRICKDNGLAINVIDKERVNT